MKPPTSMKVCKPAKEPKLQLKQTNKQKQTKTNKPDSTNLAFTAAEQKRVNLEMQLVPGRVLHTEEKTKIKSDCKYSGKFKEIYIQQYKG